MKKVIEKIEKIKGVEKVTETGCNELTVQVEKQEIAVECTNKEQWEFIFMKINMKIPSDTAFGEDAGNCFIYNCISISDSDGRASTQSKNYFQRECKNYKVIPFSEYLSDYNLKDEWEKYLIGEAEKRYPVGTKYKAHVLGTYIINTPLIFKETRPYGYCVGEESAKGWLYYAGKWATIIEPELELVSGEIYTITDNGRYSFRFKSIGSDKYANYLSSTNPFEIENLIYIKDRKLRLATNKQKAKLIKAELKNGYLWNGKELIKYK